MRMNRTWTGLAAAALVVCGPAAAGEAKPAEDVAALRAEVKRLAAELAAMKAGQAKAVPLPAATAPAEAVPASMATAAPELARAVLAVTERLDEVEVKQKDAVVSGDLPGSFRVPGTEISLRLYGFAELNWVHGFKGDNSDSDYSTFAPYLPLDGTPEARRTDRDYLTGRTSRLGIEGGTPTKFGVLSVKLEGDFNNEPRLGNASQNGAGGNVLTQQSTSSYGFRVRHLYGQLGGLLAGQTWSTFQDVDNFPETVDYNGPIGQTFIRQPQIRYTYATPDWGSYTVALENSSSYVLDDTASVMASGLSRIPDLVVRWDKSFEKGAVSVRAMTQELRVDDGNGHTASTRGWGAAASALYKTREAGDFVTLGVTGGDGIGRYLNYIEGAFYDGTANEVRAERAIGVYAGYQLKATGWVRVNAAYGATRDFNNDYTAFAVASGNGAGRFGINRWVQQAHLGPIFTPMKGIDLGLEGIWAKRETLAGEKGEDRRLNFSIKYYIN